VLDLFRSQGEHFEQFDHDFDDYICHKRVRRNVGVNLETLDEIAQVFEEIEKGIIT